MARWEPDARGRLQQAALSLFRERGYAEVTVAEIAERAGLTKRTFFNHFADKREAFFGTARFFEERVLAYLAVVDPQLGAMDATVQALTRCGLDLSAVVSADDAKTRLDVLLATPELRERDLTKTAELTAAMVEALGHRGVPARTAAFTAQAGLAVFNAAIPVWLANPAADFPALMQQALADLRAAVA